jgi:predicted transposase/invertase (TIGR01784 family)
MNTSDRAYTKEELEGLVPDIRYDNVFKAVFADEAEPRSLAALSGLLSAIIGQPLTVTGIIQNEPAMGFIGEKQIRYDVNCVLDGGSRCNVEMTLHPMACESIRIEYYATKTHTGQQAKGKRYSDIVPTYQVSVLGGAMLSDEEYLHRFLFYDPVHNISLEGRISVFTLELTKIEKIARSKAAKDMTSAERWGAYFLYNADESAFARKLIEDIKQEEEGVKMATEVISVFSEDEKRFFRLLSEQKYEMDHYTRMMEAEERGEERGIQIGEERERIKAVAEKNAAMDALRAAGISEELIAQVYK